MGAEIVDQKITGSVLLLAGVAVGYVIAIKLIERRFRRLPWYKKALLVAVQMLPGR